MTKGVDNQDTPEARIRKIFAEQYMRKIEDNLELESSGGLNGASLFIQRWTGIVSGKKGLNRVNQLLTRLPEDAKEKELAIYLTDPKHKLGTRTRKVVLHCLDALGKTTYFTAKDYHIDDFTTPSNYMLLMHERLKNFSGTVAEFAQAELTSRDNDPRNIRGLYEQDYSFSSGAIPTF